MVNCLAEAGHQFGLRFPLQSLPLQGGIEGGGLLDGRRGEPGDVGEGPVQLIDRRQPAGPDVHGIGTGGLGRGQAGANDIAHVDEVSLLRSLAEDAGPLARQERVYGRIAYVELVEIGGRIDVLATTGGELSMTGTLCPRDT